MTRRAGPGFTLLDLMIAVALLGLAMFLGWPFVVLVDYWWSGGR